MTDVLKNLSKGTQIMLASEQLAQLADWNEWMKKIPAIPFKEDWKVRIIPPMVGATVRFWVFAIGDVEEKYPVSVFLDCHNAIGMFPGPYWEINPYKGECKRIAMNDVDELVESLNEALYDLVVKI